MEIDDRTALFARFNWDHTAFPRLPRFPWITFKDIHISPSAEYPTGQKGLALERYWTGQNPNNDHVGLLIMDGDVIVDPLDVRFMLDAIENDPSRVYTAPIKLWITADNKMGAEWRWSHQNDDGMSQDIIQYPRYFSFGFTWLPADLLDACVAGGLHRYIYPYVDAFVSDIAFKLDIQSTVIYNCEPKHLPRQLW
jgi:hypothetical protein